MPNVSVILDDDLYTLYKTEAKNSGMSQSTFGKRIFERELTGQPKIPQPAELREPAKPQKSESELRAELESQIRAQLQAEMQAQQSVEKSDEAKAAEKKKTAQEEADEYRKVEYKIDTLLEKRVKEEKRAEWENQVKNSMLKMAQENKDLTQEKEDFKSKLELAERQHAEKSKKRCETCATVREIDAYSLVIV